MCRDVISGSGHHHGCNSATLQPCNVATLMSIITIVIIGIISIISIISEMSIISKVATLQGCKVASS